MLNIFLDNYSWLALIQVLNDKITSAFLLHLICFVYLFLDSMMNKYLLQIIDEDYEVLSCVSLIGSQPRHKRKVEARAFKQYDQINDHGIYVN